MRLDEWPPVALGEVARVEIGGTPSRNEPSFWESSPRGHPWLSIADLTGKRVSQTAEHISDRGVRYSNVKLIPSGTPVMSFKLTIGRAALTDIEIYSNEAIAAFHIDPRRVDPEWLYYELASCCFPSGD